MQNLIALGLAFLLTGSVLGQRLIGQCEGCEWMLEGMPANPAWSVHISGKEEPGDPLVIRGTIFKADGKTPAPGVVLYVYHTNQKGIYEPAPGQTQARRHGHLRGWMKSDSRGRYEFTTIRPGAYPGNRAAQHIHPILLEPNGNYYYIDEYLFDDDPLLTANERTRQEGRGGNGIIKLAKDSHGRWTGTRDIVLGRNIPGYP